MIRKNTWIILVLLALVIGAAVYFNHQKSTSASTATPTSSQTFLFGSQDGNATDIKISDTNGDTVEISRNPTGTWVLKAPTAVAADQSQAEAAASQVSSLNMLGNEQIGLPDVGLDKPTYTMTITFDSAKTHKVLIGMVNPIQTGYYVQVDSGPVQLVDKSGLDALVGMLTAPPYLATLTPTVTLTPLPSDTPTAAPTFTPAATDTPVSLTPTSGTAVSTTPGAPSATPTP
jgi:hypothetical protein